MTELDVVSPRLRVRRLLIPMAVGLFTPWLALGVLLGFACAFGLLRTFDSANRRLYGLAAFTQSVVLGASLGVVVTVISCLGLPLALRLYERRERARVADRAPAS